MSLVEMQAALARLYVDGPFLERFCADPATVAREYDLTPREATALAGIDHDAIRKFAGSLRVKTWGRFKVPYRLLRALDNATAFKYFQRFFELRTIRPNESFYRPTVELGEFFEASFAGNPEWPPYAAELVRYERLFYIARFQPRTGGESRPGEPGDDATLPVDARLVKAPGIRLERFGYDMRALDKALSEERVPEAVEPRECDVVFQSFEQVGRARKFRVSPPTAQLLGLCDGERDLAALGDALEADLDAVREAAESLFRHGVLIERGRR